MFSPKAQRPDFLDDQKWSTDAVIPGDGDDPLQEPLKLIQAHASLCPALGYL